MFASVEAFTTDKVLSEALSSRSSLMAMFAVCFDTMILLPNVGGRLQQLSPAVSR
jgi:hypothetical protein